MSWKSSWRHALALDSKKSEAPPTDLVDRFSRHGLSGPAFVFGSALLPLTTGLSAALTAAEPFAELFFDTAAYHRWIAFFENRRNLEALLSGLRRRL